MSSGKPIFSVEDLMGSYPPPIQETAENLRRIIFEIAPTATEKANKGWRSISYRDSQLGYFCGIFPFQDRVDLIFEFGALLPDPGNLLQGETKQVRYLRFHTPDEIDAEPIKHFLLAALELPPGYSTRRGLTTSQQ